MAFGVFVARHRGAVYRFVRGLTTHDADAEDVLQQTFVAAWRAAADARVEHGARPFLFTIARHALHRLYRHHGVVTDDSVSLEELGARAGFAASDATAERFAQAVEEREVLIQAIAALPHLEREVLQMRDLEGLSGEQVAAAVGISLPAMKSRLHRARLRLVAEVRRRFAGGTEP
jgi:RNA polymerase sigma-70 factor, ECF subfamily